MRALALFAAMALALGAALGGAAPFGRALMALGAPEWAGAVFQDPDWRAAARYRAGDYAGAAEDWTASRRHFNRGNALVRDGNYAAALEAYDLAIARGDGDAAANFDLVAAYYAGLGLGAEVLALLPPRKEGPTMDSSIAEGDARAAGTGDEVNNANTMLGLAELDSRGRLGVRRVFDDTFIVADERWLNQLEDVPGKFMQARIAHEHKRRRKAGLSPPPAEDPR